jgi:hypothetical protein
MNVRGPDIVASVRFYPTSEGGRRVPTPINLFRCPLEFEGEKFDCGLHLDKVGSLAPGATASVPITIVFPKLVKPRLKVGSRFTLWEMGTIAEGVVDQILP